MADLDRIRVQWVGSSVVGAGLSTFYVTSGTAGAPAALHTFFDTIKAALKNGESVTIPNTGDTIDVATGAINGTWTSGTASSVTFTGSNQYASGVGTRVAWTTNGIRAGRRVRGATYLVPLDAGVYFTDGRIVASTQAAILGAANALLAALPGALEIYSRPSGALPGMSSPVTGAVVNGKVSWLRSRRT